MSFSEWHVAAVDLSAYLGGEVGPVDRVSLESHVMECALVERFSPGSVRRSRGTCGTGLPIASMSHDVRWAHIVSARPVSGISPTCR